MVHCHHEISGRVQLTSPDPLAPRSTKRGSILTAMARTCLCPTLGVPSLGMEVCLENDAERTSHNTFGKGTFVFKAKFGWEALILWKEADSSSHTNARSVVPPEPIIISQPCHDTLDLTMEIRRGRTWRTEGA